MSRMDQPAGQSSTGEAVEQAREKASEVGQSLRDVGGQVREAAKEQYDHLRQQAGDYYERGRDAAMEWEQELEHYIQDRPLQSLMIAAGVGFLLGALWKRS